MKKLDMKVLLLVFLGLGCLVEAHRRIDKVIEDCKNLGDFHPEPPSYLRNIAEFVVSTSTTPDPPPLTGHHLVPGSRLRRLFVLLANEDPATLVSMLRDLYNNQSPRWRQYDENSNYLEAIRCLDSTVEDAELTTTTNIDEFCGAGVAQLYSLFFWRPDNIQIGPTERFREFRDSYDYDCSYLLRGAELAHSIAFRDIVDEILRQGGGITGRQSNLLLRIHRNLLAARGNAPRFFNHTEWPEATIQSDTPDDCWAARHFRDTMNILERTNDFDQTELNAFNEASKTLNNDAIDRLKEWTRNTTQRIITTDAIREIASKIERHNHHIKSFKPLLVQFLQHSRQISGFREFRDAYNIYITIAMQILTHESTMAEFITYLPSDPIYLIRGIIEFATPDYLVNAEAKIIHQLLKKTKVSYGNSRGYTTEWLHANMYNIHFLAEFLGHVPSEDFSPHDYERLQSVEYDNITSTVREFNEKRNPDDDDDENEFYRQQLHRLYAFVSQISQAVSNIDCNPNTERNVRTLLGTTARSVVVFSIISSNHTCEPVKRYPVSGENDNTDSQRWQDYYEKGDFAGLDVRRFADGSFAYSTLVQTPFDGISFDSSERWLRNEYPSSIVHQDLRKRRKVRDSTSGGGPEPLYSFQGIIIFDKFHRPLIVSFPEIGKFMYFNRSKGTFAGVPPENWRQYIAYGEKSPLALEPDYNVDGFLCDGLQALNLASSKRILEKTCWTEKSSAWRTWKDSLQYVTPTLLQKFIAMEFLDGSFSIGIYKPYRARKSTKDRWITEEWAIPDKWPGNPFYNADGPYYGMLIFDKKSVPIMALFRENVNYIHALIYTAERKWKWSPFEDIVENINGRSDMSLISDKIDWPWRRCAGKPVRYF